MTMTPAIKQRLARSKKGVGMPGDNSAILTLARRLRATVDAPAVGGIAVYLHGVARSTIDLDLYTTDRTVTAAQLEAAGARWNKERREHRLDGIPIHTITPDDAGIVIEKTSLIDGIRVVTLKDLIAIKLLSGLNNPGRHKDLGDVEELIRAVPLDKRFAARLPKNVRAEFKSLIDGVLANQKHLPPNRRF